MRIILLITIYCLLNACSTSEESSNQNTYEHSIVPRPVEITDLKGKSFKLSSVDFISTNGGDLNDVVQYLKNAIGIKAPVKDSGQGKLSLSLSDEIDKKDGYILTITEEKIMLKASDKGGLIYGIETLRQLMPVNGDLDKIEFPTVEITDYPRFAWRGMHLDVSRHFMPADFIKKYIDILAFHKMNIFHWHLVDGIGWRLEIKSHPELTEQGGWRIVKEGKKPWQDYETWKPGDKRERYGGYYTQQEVKEIINYAAEKNITIIPEIELPGHSQVVFDIFPELICVDGNGEPLSNGGVYCAANEKSYQLLEDILDEVIDLFPSEYIHIGGDEVGKGNWKKCARCTAMMKEKDYTPEELQSHFVNHFDEYLRAKGRKLIGWHEITEGELSETAAIMYWGGHGGTANYVRKGHKTVLSPGSHLYFDHYQSLSKHEPKAFGGYSNLKKVYSFEPIPEDLEMDLQKNILGIQANVWTEYMPNPEHVQYMILPRMAALSEVAWSPQGKDWGEFRKKLPSQLQRYEQEGYIYAESGFRPEINLTLEEDKTVTVNIETEIPSNIFYSTTDRKPEPFQEMVYDKPFTLKEGATIVAISAVGNKIMTEPESIEAVLHKARGAEVELENEGYGKYKAKGGKTLVDVEFGADKWGNGKWLGVLSKDLIATVKLEEISEISKVSLSCIEETGAGIYFPKEFIVLTSTNGSDFTEFGRVKNDRELPIDRTPDIKTRWFTVEGETVNAKFIKVIAGYQKVENQGVFIFADELIVE